MENKFTDYILKQLCLQGTVALSDVAMHRITGIMFMELEERNLAHVCARVSAPVRPAQGGAEGHAN